MNAEGLDRGHTEGSIVFAGVRPGNVSPGYGRMCASCLHTWARHEVEYIETQGGPPLGGLVSCPDEGCWCVGTWAVRR